MPHCVTGTSLDLKNTQESQKGSPLSLNLLEHVFLRAVDGETDIHTLRLLTDTCCTVLQGQV